MSEPTFRMNRAIAGLQRLAAFGSPYGSRISAEIEYGQAYQELVRTGERRQLRKKYRGQP